MNKQQVHHFACFVAEYHDKNIPCDVILSRYGINVSGLNTREAVDAYIKHNRIELEPIRKRK